MISAEQSADHGAEVRRRRHRRTGFPQVVLRTTMVVHAVLVVALTELCSRLGIPYPLLTACAIAALLVLPLRGRLDSLMWDTPRPHWKLLLVDEPYFAHWCATMMSAPFVLIACIVEPLIDVARGSPPSLPGSFALSFYLGSLATSAYAVAIRRRWVVVRDIDVPVSALPEAFEGFTIAQLSDLHVGGMLPPGLADRWVTMSNRREPDLVAITGDLVTSGVNFHDEIARVLSGLRGREGVVVSMGNHDYFGEGDPLVGKLRGAGLRVLRNEELVIRRGDSALRICAVDDTWSGRADLDRTLEPEAAPPTGAPTVLLAHDPDLFDKAHRLGADLVLSGHTHAGQFAVPFLVKHVNLARMLHKYTFGVYRKGRSTLYVHAGLGTTGPPARLGAAPELVFLRLRRG